MMDSAFYGFVKHNIMHDECRNCGGAKRAAYRYMYLCGRWVYMILPCHGCQYAEFRAAPSPSNVEVSPTWVDLPEQEQRDRIDREYPRQVTEDLEPEETVEPSEEDSADEVDEEA